MSESASDAVYRALFEDIRKQRLAPNAILQEEELAARFGVSRTPVREAVRRLIQDGLLERRGVSTSVRQLTVAEVANIYPLIAVLEGLAARLAADRISESELQELEEMHIRMTGELANLRPPLFRRTRSFTMRLLTRRATPHWRGRSSGFA